MKDLVCGNVEQKLVELGITPCGALVNGISFGLLLICAVLKL